uniref:Uncharacterized protein n=1 Tax=Schizaphis graminum TaxID=13262 RepID=A0A2S2P4N6_SCHGA
MRRLCRKVNAEGRGRSIKRANFLRARQQQRCTHVAYGNFRNDKNRAGPVTKLRTSGYRDSIILLFDRGKMILLCAVTLVRPSTVEHKNKYFHISYQFFSAYSWLGFRFQNLYPYYIRVIFRVPIDDVRTHIQILKYYRCILLHNI